MGSMRNWMLGAAVVFGGLGLGATKAHAAQFGVYIGGQTAYVPPCPGPGYVWVAGYTDDGYWIPGRWRFAGYVDRDGYSGYYSYRDGDRNRGWQRGWEQDHDRGWARDRDRGRDRDRRWHRDDDH
jgi:hypothetical protein